MLISRDIATWLYQQRLDFTPGMRPMKHSDQHRLLLLHRLPYKAVPQFGRLEGPSLKNEAMRVFFNDVSEPDVQGVQNSGAGI